MQSDTEQAPRRRGRPREFDFDIALAAMTRVFRARGFSAASLDDLSAAADLNRPSLYAAFGDKEQVYLRALELYGRDTLARTRAILAGAAPIEERVAAVYQAAIAAYCEGDPAPGCLLATTAATAATLHASIAKTARALRQAHEDEIARAFETCVAAKLLPREPAPAMRAKLATAVLDTLAVRARIGEPRKALETFAQEAVALVCVA